MIPKLLRFVQSIFFDSNRRSIQVSAKEEVYNFTEGLFLPPVQPWWVLSISG